MNNKVYEDIDEIIQKVYDDYRNESTELNSLFFDFDVKASKEYLLRAYADIQDTINGDAVVHLENPQILEGGLIKGYETDFYEETYQEIYEGNYKDFLLSFNGKELETGFCRLIAYEDKIENNKTITIGNKVDFIL